MSILREKLKIHSTHFVSVTERDRAQTRFIIPLTQFMDLPTAWNSDDKSIFLSVDSSGLRVNYEGLGESDAEIGKNKIIGIGFCEKDVSLNRMPGWEMCSWGYHGDDVFYTKNGINLGVAFRNLGGILYPCVGLRSHGASIEVNFGHKKFKYAINAEIFANLKN
ncbi:SPRY-domain-containing protein [Gigaspora margarita]|uniref:SPRY-domain-containing protein n=1 Tax=Gigaspora margarita TaxID=4874 RepID=A0A8H4AXV6_GIGMA|nr:SPRY-domain-containing protein [Gigaspora margarita]